MNLLRLLHCGQRTNVRKKEVCLHIYDLQSGGYWDIVYGIFSVRIKERNVFAAGRKRHVSMCAVLATLAKKQER